jgi:hypothetical protein
VENNNHAMACPGRWVTGSMMRLLRILPPTAKDHSGG